MKYGKRKSHAGVESKGQSESGAPEVPAPKVTKKRLKASVKKNPDTTTPTSGDMKKASIKKKKKSPGTTTLSSASVTENPDTSSEKKPKQAAKKQRLEPVKSEITQNQIFVGGVGDMSDERLREHFSQFGPISSAAVVKDKTSKKSRGFAFVTFADADSVEKTLKLKHVIDDKPVDCRSTVPTSDTGGWECFVGGLPKSVTAEALQDYFRRFGEVVGGRIMIDAVSQQSRGFGFVEFASRDNMATVLNATHTVEGAVVSTKIAEQKRPTKKEAPVAKSNAVFLGGLPKDVPEQELRDMCGQFGPLTDVIIKLDPVTGNCRGFAFVTFAKHKGFLKCLEAAQNGKVAFKGWLLSARAAHSKTSKDSYYPKKSNKKRTKAKVGEE